MSNAVVEQYSFESIEQLDEVTRDLGWATEYRQLHPGAFSSTFTVLDDEAWFLLQEQSSLSVEAEAPAPAGMFLLAVVQGNPAVVNGQVLSADHVFVQSPDAEFRVTLPEGIMGTQIGILAEEFEDMIDAIAPGLSIPAGTAATIPAAAGRLTGLRRAMNSALLAPSNPVRSRSECVSRILAEFIAVLADHSGFSRTGERHGAGGRRALDTAIEYIDAHLDEAIRVDYLCRCAGTSLRSLERLFAKDLGVSPQQYIKVRRLHSVRRHLLAEQVDHELRVTDVALRHGFTHLGRFAGDYRRYFGETPRQTLQGR